MGYCFAPDCKHRSETHSCKFYKCPTKEAALKKWEQLVRRADRTMSPSSRICQCHFKDGLRENGPTIFKHNQQRCMETIASPKKEDPKSHHKRKSTVDVNSPPTGMKADNPVDTSYTDEDIEIFEQLEAEANDDNEVSCSKDEDDSLIRLEKENKILSELLRKEDKPLTFESLKHQVKIFKHYTGISPDHFNGLFCLFENVNINYFYGWEVTCISKESQLLLFLLKMRCNFTHDDLAYRFHVSTTTVRNVFLTWLHLVHKFFFIGVFCRCGIPSRRKNQICLPSAFKEYKNCRIILDCTEFRIEKPGKMDLQKDTYSSYKSANTFKALLGIAPNGCPTFASKLYPGSKSDKEVVSDSKVLDQMEPGDCILADKGFLIADILPAGVTLNMPPFLCTPQFTAEQVIISEKIASARTHVERAIKRIREYRILKLIPAQYRDCATMIWQTCVALQEFNGPLIKEVEKFM